VQPHSEYEWVVIFTSPPSAFFSATAAYFIICYFLNRAADSLQLEKGQLKGVLSITKLVLIVIAIIITFQFSNVSGAAAGAIFTSYYPSFLLGLEQNLAAPVHYIIEIIYHLCNPCSNSIRLFYDHDRTACIGHNS
jgi:hypothetical protein